MTWTMPRDMSGFSTLEAELLSAICAVQLPEPVAEYVFMPRCCAHPKRRHTPNFEMEPQMHCDACCTGGGDDSDECVHDYDAGRRWRFDFAWPALKVAAECEGGVHTGGRHVTGTGFEKDAEKYNAAAVQGWTVLRFTQRQITSGAALESLEKVLSRAVR